MTLIFRNGEGAEQINRIAATYTALAILCEAVVTVLADELNRCFIRSQEKRL